MECSSIGEKQIFFSFIQNIILVEGFICLQLSKFQTLYIIPNMNLKKNNQIIHILLASFLIYFIINPSLLIGQVNGFQKCKYEAINGAIVGHNIGNYNNRPLYINNTDAFILAGDKPIARLAKDHYLYGTFMLAVERNGKLKWLQECDQITSIYRQGKMTWQISDKEFLGLKVHLEILPMATTIGMTIKAKAEGAIEGDKLIWIYGGAKWYVNNYLSHFFDAIIHPEIINWTFNPEDCKFNKVENSILNSIVSYNEKNVCFGTIVNCSEPFGLNVCDASKWKDGQFLLSKFKDYPLLSGSNILSEGTPVFLSFETFSNPKDAKIMTHNDPIIAFKDGIKRINSFDERVKINTPDEQLNSIVKAQVAAVDGTWYPPVFVHGAMQYNVAFPGWRTIFGGTMFGWHDRVLEEAKYYISSQVKVSDKKVAKADPKVILALQDTSSRFYGVGHIEKDQQFYNMQSQFFDQIIEDWRFTANQELESLLRPSLELHLQWLADCFDPDGDGVYTSYLNTWPTDSQWYNGGGTAEETSYAYRGHLAARDMARNANNIKSEEYHKAMLEKIKAGFFQKMWITQKGHSGSYIEEGGHKRLHTDPWLYSIFLPIDAGLTSFHQAIESVYYSEWALQNDLMPNGGRMVWPSNWMPGRFSVRELWPGDNYALALSYYQAGLPTDAWEILKGTFVETGYNGVIPGSLGGKQGGIDFGDCLHPFTRAVDSGLFGYNPDYPNGIVRIRPQFPKNWKYSSIELPDVKIHFRSNANVSTYSIELTNPAILELLLPVQSNGIEYVTVNGVKSNWELIPAVGESLIKVKTTGTKKVEITYKLKKSVPYYNPESLIGNVGDDLKIEIKEARIIDVVDSQGVFNKFNKSNNFILGTLSNNIGFHTFFVRVKIGSAEQWRVFRIKIIDPVGDKTKQEKFVREVPTNASWSCIDISKVLNTDVTKIYEKLYLTPRPNTVSARIGVDGYSPWTHPFWNLYRPIINLDNVKGMLDNQSCLITSQKIPFLWNPVYGFKNVAFTSLWDNYPSKIDFPVNSKGDAVYFLVSGTTNMMQCQIANAEIRLNYADGQTDSLELIPPLNFWSLCPIGGQDYTDIKDKFCLPGELPQRVQLGENCRAMLLNLKMRKGVELKSITLETLSQEVVVGLMGITIMKL